LRSLADLAGCSPILQDKIEPSVPRRRAWCKKNGGDEEQWVVGGQWLVDEERDGENDGETDEDGAKGRGSASCGRAGKVLLVCETEAIGCCRTERGEEKLGVGG
jgi:hypothetical protein